MSSATAQPKIAVVPDAAGGPVGAVVWWQLAGDLDAARLAEAWAAAGLPPELAPRPTTERRALSRAVRGQAHRHRIPRRLGGAAWSLVDETIVGDDQSYRPVARARVTATGALDVEAPEEIARGVRAHYERFLGAVTAHDVSWWLCGRVMPRLRAIALRELGGVYFVPRESVERYRAIAGALAQVGSHRLYEVPAVRTDQAVEAFLDALAMEAQAELDGIQHELDHGDLGGRALVRRKRACESLAEKLSAYEGLLGRGLESLRERTEALTASVAAAALAAMIDEE